MRKSFAQTVANWFRKPNEFVQVVYFGLHEEELGCLSVKSHCVKFIPQAGEAWKLRQVQSANLLDFPDQLLLMQAETYSEVTVLEVRTSDDASHFFRLLVDPSRLQQTAQVLLDSVKSLIRAPHENALPDNDASVPASVLLSPQDRKMLSLYIPPRCQDWTLAYSPRFHGASLRAFFRHTARRTASVLVVKDSEGSVFGAYTSDNWRLSKTYYGNGESFLFKAGSPGQVYPASLNNDFYMTADYGGLSLGAGSGTGLFLASDLSGGYSQPCDTFNNETLSCNEHFSLVDLEVWALT